MPHFQSPRGTRDILPEEQAIWSHVKAVAEKVAVQMGYQPITVPTYEEVGLFKRAIGEGTDIQDKELFLVRGVQTEQGKEHYALRPEGTAGITRAFIEHGMQTWPQPVKLFSFVNVFRYDRPQKGRYREHVQFDIEYFGDTEPFSDAWIIYTTWRFLSELDLDGCSLQLNTLGTVEEREAYIETFKEYCLTKESELSEDSRRRITTNPLRILDSKDSNDQKIVATSPKLRDFLGAESLAHYEKVKDYLTSWKIPFTEDLLLVRGLDYYSKTAFEWSLISDQGQQSSLGGGGRYDDLLKKLDGPEVGAVGAGIGLDRVIEELIRQEKTSGIKAATPMLYLIAADEKGAKQIPQLIDTFYRQIPSLTLDCNLSKISVSNQLKRADKIGATFALILGETEIQSEHFTIKNLQKGTQESIRSLEALLEFLKHAV